MWANKRKNKAEMSATTQKVTLIQKLVRYPIFVANTAKTDLIAAYNKDYFTLGVTLAKYYAIYVLGKFILKTVFNQTLGVFRRRIWSQVAVAKGEHNKAVFRKHRQDIAALGEDNPNKIPGDVIEVLPYSSVTQIHQYLLSGKLTCVQLLNFFL